MDSDLTSELGNLVLSKSLTAEENTFQAPSSSLKLK